ncbi:uroporphyrinogen decarboxylase family protein [Notoacmeibacter sp. MSK16QG-6]|uniref:uroporphyrinogen decarboxylase family protein n=1 Tax=Notoacmeibacter sp. MSK16QG-6 TaxID=2957982 RepID=UPI00209E472E|nr:uroporphyrinogen decarboxylase family protein [Notoacmeibacter sp. MSK16QG-6]MCP1199505.1 uroporphyrinogen decarboxylase [Notoacmeibacter sp. MSK16QG-6]
MKMVPMERAMPAMEVDIRERILVDLGTSSLNAPRVQAVGPDANPALVAHPIYETLALNAWECRALGSNFQRIGPLFSRLKRDEEDIARDNSGVDWLWSDGFPAQLGHPLEKAAWPAIACHPRPCLPEEMQIADVSAGAHIVADAPCPGLLDTCFALRNGWRFLDDITGDWQVASALLDWALETCAAAYEHMLSAAPVQPDIVIYGDDLGFQGGMYLSDTDFRHFVLPRLKTLISRIRAKTDAVIVLHSCGGVRSILGDLVALGIEGLNLDFYAKGMEIAAIRKAIPKDMILHGPVDLGVLGRAARRRDRAAVASHAMQIAAAGRHIASAPDNISERGFLDECVAGAAAVRALDTDDLRALRRTGPVKSIIEKMIATAEAFEMPEISGETPRVASVTRTHSPQGIEGGASQPRYTAATSGAASHGRCAD